MKLLADWKIEHHGTQRSIELYRGDLSCLPPEDAVDVLVVSAFQNDYLPTPTSLIGALARNGISLSRLSFDKERDMREELSCWMSKPLKEVTGFRRILCIESGWRGTPPEIADDIFRALAPCSISEFPNGSVAMPLIGTGDQGYPAVQIMEATLKAAVFWFRHGLNLRTLKIVIHSEHIAACVQDAFLAAREADALVAAKNLRAGSNLTERGSEQRGCDVFLSYSHEDSTAALSIVETIREIAPAARLFFDKETLKTGDSWLMRIAEALDQARLVIAIYTPNYWTSKFCKDEFVAAFMRQSDTGTSILFPLYYRTSPIPYLFRGIQLLDCREGDLARLTLACRSLRDHLI